MTEQEAISVLESNLELIKKLDGGVVGTLGRAIEVALPALEKQIPKNPDYEGDGCDKDGNIIYDTWICPCCGGKYEVDYDNYKCCPNCGQAINSQPLPEPYKAGEINE